MPRNLLQTALIYCSAIAYITICIAIFLFPSLVVGAQALASLLTYTGRATVFGILFALLCFPNLYAVISYVSRKAADPDSDYQISEFLGLIFDILIILCIAAFLKEAILPDPDTSQISLLHRTQTYLSILLILSLILVWFSPCFRLLRNVISIEDANGHLLGIVRKPPYINFHVRAYHYQTKTRTVTRTQPGGYLQGSQTRTETETYQELVQTLNRTQPYQVRSWRDTSGAEALSPLPGTRITKIKLRTLVCAANSKAKAHYQTAWENFRTRYRSADIFVEFSSSSGVCEMEKRFLLALPSTEEKPIFLNVVLCFVSYLTPFRWAYSLWLDSMSITSERLIKKEYL